MEKREFDYFYENENENFLFLQIPMALMKDEKFKKLSNDSKLLYSLFLQRTSLSRKNGWKDEEGRVYIIYQITEIMDELNCWREKATKLMKELKEIGLIKTIRQGLTKPNIIYVMNFSTEYKYPVKDEPKNPENAENTGIFENQTSDIPKIKYQGLPKNDSQYFLKSKPSHIDRNKKNLNQMDVRKSTSSQTSSSKIEDDLTDDADIDILPDNEPVVLKSENKPTYSQTQKINPKKKPEADNTPVYDYNAYKKIIHDNISYSHFKQHHQWDIKMIDELVECMLDVITTQSKRVKINSDFKDRQIVINKYLSLHASDIQHILLKYQEQTGKITHISSYLKTLLYTVKQERNSFYTNSFRAEGLLL